MSEYPRITVDHNKLRSNMKQVISWCTDAGISVAGVIKASNGMASAALDYESCGAGQIASSRLEQLARAKENGAGLPLMMIRVPMISELAELVEICDYSLQSEIDTIRELNRAAAEAGRMHKVILMADLGDLREGFFESDELLDAAGYVENECDALYLAGIGTNLGCYGSVVPTKEKMEQLVQYAEATERAIGRRLDIISGGATSSLIPLFDGAMPERINHLRIGALPFFGPNEDIRISYGRSEVDILYADTFVLEAEVIEVKTKPTMPIGELGVDAFGKKRKYTDRGPRKRALIAIGRQDYGDIDNVTPLTEGAMVIGASGDHTIVDIEDCTDIICVGDIMKFKMNYSGMLYLTSSENVKVNEIGRL